MRRKAITVGAQVICRFYNTPDQKFYGPSFGGTVLRIEPAQDKPYLIKRHDSPDIWLHRKEILSVR